MPEEMQGEEEEDEDEEMDEEYTPEMAQELMRRGLVLSKYKLPALQLAVLGTIATPFAAAWLCILLLQVQ